MIFLKNSILITCISIATSVSAIAQIRCGSTEYTQSLERKFLTPERSPQFEEWLRQHINKKQQTIEQQRKKNDPYKIPVVVHVIHNGEPVGSGTNISDEQIYSQINVLNDDYNRRNEDASQTPNDFQSVAGSINIQFVLAKQDPQGNITTGIVRKKGSKTGWKQADDNLLKLQSYWPSENYLNVWVCNITDGFIGYAQFPVSNLQGLEEFQQEIAATDGVVISYDAFGSIDDGGFNLLSKFNKGRTLTHEVGHFFGLRHIWGDDSNCSGTDYVNDTPNQDQETINCPSHPRITCSPDITMFQNFMDYTNDACMNLFTEGQIERMKVIIENSIRRKSLLTSPGLINPLGEDKIHDVALRSIINPEPVSCTGPVLTLKIQNLGDTLLNFVRVTHRINNSDASQTNVILSPSINPLNYTEIKIPLNIEDGLHTINVTIDSPNGKQDVDPTNNSQQKTVLINALSEELPARQRFEGTFPNAWNIVNPYTETNWKPLSTVYNQSAMFETTNSQTETAWIVSPVFDFTNIHEANLRFDWANYNASIPYAKLQLKYTTDCGETYYDLPGFSLTETTTSVVPLQEEEWNTAVVSLSPVLNKSNVRLAFVASTQIGSIIYTDNIEVYTGPASIKMPIEQVMAIFPAETGGIVITFNLETLQSIDTYVLDMMGREILYANEEKILNQNFTLNLENIQTGIYIVRIKANNQYYSKRVFIPGR